METDADALKSNTISLVEQEPKATEGPVPVESRVVREIDGRRVTVVIVDVELLVVAEEVSKSIGSERTRQLSEIVADATDPDVR